MIATALPLEDCEGDTAFDWQIAAATMAALGSSKYSALRKLKCLVFGGVVEIRGVVPSFYLKQLAQAAVLQVHHGEVRNLIEVQAEPDSTSATAPVRNANRVAIH